LYLVSCTFILYLESSVLRVAYYYHQSKRLAADHEGNNPYGALLCDALERHGLEVEYSVDYSPEYLRRNQGRIDVLHWQWPHHDYYHDDAEIMQRQMEDLLSSLELARELGYKVVWTAHNIYPHNRTHQEIDHEFQLHLCRLATAIIAHCEVNAEGVRREFGRSHDLFIIPHGHFIGVYPYRFSRSECRSELGVPESGFVYGFIGGILPYKGIEEFADAFCRLPEPDCWLLAAGGGPAKYVDSLWSRIGDHPRILSNFVHGDMKASNEDLIRVLTASDVVVLPFHATMSSGSVVLALSHARPVIAPALGCLPSTLLPGGGILYDPKRKDALLEAMREVQGWDRDAASETALASVQRLDWDGIAKKTLEAYRA